MSKVDELYDLMNKNIEDTFRFDRYYDIVIGMIKDFHFLGEIDKESLYIQQLIQIKDCEDNLHMLTPEEAEEYYLTGEIKGYYDWQPQWSLHWFVNLEKKYIRVYTGLKIDQRKSPKDNYGIVYETIEPKIRSKESCAPFMYEFNVADSPDKETWEKLIAIVEYSKTNEVEFADFDKKIRQDMRKYWGIINNKSCIDDEFKDTQRPEVIKIPQAHGDVQILEEMDFRRTLRGGSFLEIDFEHNGFIKSFDKVKDMKDYFYSAIDFINANNSEFKINQKIKYMEKHYLSNKWPISKDEDEADANKKKYTFYKVFFQKYRDKIVVRAEVSEYGIYYIITNYYENKFCEFVEKH